MKRKLKSIPSSLSRALAILLAVLSASAHAHAFPDHANPAADASLTSLPDKIQIWFNSPLEPLFSHVSVKDAAGKIISKNDHIDQNDTKLLMAELQAKGKGSYHVYWNVVSVDGHRTQGDYAFTVQ
jgi:methionine-rich copper-binding protein CopC